MSLFQWPFKRKQYAGLNNPRFVGDIVAANEAVIDALAVITGMNNTDFAIISGLDYVVGIQNTYTAGWFYLNGVFYFMPTTFVEGLFLVPTPTDTMNQPFGDGVNRNIYTLLSAGTTNVYTVATTPAFAGTMNQYRIGLKKMKVDILSLLATQNILKGGAFADIGTTAGTVASGDASYSKLDTDTAFGLKADKSDVLQLDNTTPYTPTASTHPATKGYVDGLAVRKLASGTKIVGDISPSYTATIPFGAALADNNYIVVITLVSAAGNPYDDCSVFYAVKNKTTVSFDIYMYEQRGVVQNLSFDWIVLHL
jgi:hypothetical protein